MACWKHWRLSLELSALVFTSPELPLLQSHFLSQPSLPQPSCAERSEGHDVAQLWWRRSCCIAAQGASGALGELLCLWQCCEVVLVLKKLGFGRATLSISDAVKIHECSGTQGSPVHIHIFHMQMSLLQARLPVGMNLIYLSPLS